MITNRYPIYLVAALLSLVARFELNADSLELKNGKLLSGRYLGGTSTTLRFETSEGLRVFPKGDLLALTFSSNNPVSANPAPTATQQPVIVTPSSPEMMSVIPPGSTFLVKMMDSISSKNSKGSIFTTKLEYDLVVNGATLLSKGTVIYGRVHASSQAGRLRGKSTLEIRLTEMVIKGKKVSIATGNSRLASAGSIRKVARGAAAGAGIGAIADGSDGARKGVAIGTALGTLKRGAVLTIAPGTLLEFSLTKAVQTP